MKIGILTHHFVNNFGAFLQAYALREALAQEFPDDTVEIIDFINIKQYVINSLGWFRYYRDRENLKCWIEKIQVPWTFAQARKQYMVLSKRCYSTAQVNQLGYDTIVFGSDEIWNYQDKRSTAKIKFGCGINCKNKIAYAPSVGSSSGNIPHYVQDGIKGFSAVSARDSLTQNVVKDVLGITPDSVLDPTFLSNIPSSKSYINKPYILFYYCDHLPSAVKNQILEYAKNHGLAVFGAGEADKRYDEITINLSPFEWVDMFRNAEFVFTGTFHGVVFSVLNKCQFKVYLTNKSRIQKVKALLDSCGIKDREMDDRFVFDLTEEKDQINYEKVYDLLNEQRRKSKDYLFNAVELGRNADRANDNRIHIGK